MANQVASLTATITVDKGNLQKEVLQEFSSAQQTLDGKNLKVKIIGDTSEIEKAIKKLENLRKSGVKVKFDTSSGGNSGGKSSNNASPGNSKISKELRDNLAKELRLTKEIASVKEKMAKTNDSNVIAANEKRIEQLERERIGVQKLIAKTNEQYDAQARIAKLNSVAETSQSKLKTVYTERAGKLYSEAQALQEKYKNIPEGSRTSNYSANLTAINELVANLEKIQGIEIISNAEMSKVRQFAVELQKVKKNLPDSKGSKAVSRINLIDSISEYQSKNTRLTADFQKKLDDLKASIRSLGADADVSQLASEFGNLKVKIHEAGLEGRSFADVMKEKIWSQFSGQLANLFSFQQMFQYMREGIDVVHDLDNAYVEMLKVSNDALSSLRQYKLESFSRADEVGTTGEKLMNSTADWMRIGESLEKAAASAKTTNKLLNVSEFTDVNEATEAMVSMSQAYDTLSKDDIVDKLNNVGNNFSISTQGLAEGLQRSASALKTAGNDMDSAIALMTAGNAVVQDPTSVGAGLRTIALRLTGTKEGAQSLQDSGEDIDGMITTVSKLRDTIKSATAVASNGFKGFDIFDKNGNYKSTYEILLGISQVYKEIVETDAKTGSNNKNLLLETIAGKNRANIAASILENPSLLEKAYKSSKYDSKDSAQQELDRYLDSIDGRLTKLQNHADKFWNAFLNTGSVKNGISLIDGFVNRVTTLVSKFGALPTILGSMGAALTLQDVGRAKSCPSEYAYIV
ncbi:phage tail tape measure protein [Clostridium sp.]|uniref:phage tail tape measure protein n=1 Tax=Clostridium sp. TaxID=1506 RepID=UPI00257A3AEF|nr:phage tail tape measure protein [Clostridium sp.]MBD9274921.1 phage tail tape measure protein [Clostridium sp.]